MKESLFDINGFSKESPTSFVPFSFREHEVIRINNKHIEYLFIIFIFKINL